MDKEFISVTETAKKWKVTPRQIQNMCSSGKIKGARKEGKRWLIPADVERPVDGRIKNGMYIGWRKKKAKKQKEAAKSK